MLPERFFVRSADGVHGLLRVDRNTWIEHSPAWFLRTNGIDADHLSPAQMAGFLRKHGCSVYRLEDDDGN